MGTLDRSSGVPLILTDSDDSGMVPTMNWLLSGGSTGLRRARACVGQKISVFPRLFLAVLVVASRLSAATAAEPPLDSKLTELSNAFDKRIASIEAEVKTKHAVLTNRYDRQLQAILKQKQQAGDLEAMIEIRSERERLAAGKPSADPAIFTENAKDARDAASDLVASSRELYAAGAKQVVDFATNFTATLLKMQVDLTKRGDVGGGIKVRDTIKALEGRETLKTARRRHAVFEEEKARSAELAQKRKRREDIAAGRLGPFTPQPPPKGKKTSPSTPLKFNVAWDQLQKMDCNFQLYEFFASQPLENVLSQAASKPKTEKIRYVLYMVFNKLAAPEQLTQFRPEDLMDAARATFWPEELYPPRADGSYHWTACASYIAANTAYNIILVGFDKQRGNAIQFVYSYRSIPVPPEGFATVPASSHITRFAAQW